MSYPIDSKGAKLRRFSSLAGSLLLGASAASCDFTVQPATHAAQLQVVMGDDQRAEVATTVPEDLVVVAVDPRGEPVSGVPLSWTVESGALDLAETETDGDGQARARWTLGPVAGEQQVEVRTGDVATTFTARAEPGPAVAVTIRPDSVELHALGDTASFALEAADAHGNPRAGDLAWWSVADSTVARVLQAGAVALRNGATAVVAGDGEVADTAWLAVRQVPARLLLEPRGIAVEGSGEGARFTFVAVDSNGASVDEQQPQAVWTSLNPAVATVDDSGTPVAAGIGQAVIRAEAGGLAGYALVTAAVPQSTAPEWRVEDAGAMGISDLWVGEDGVGWAVTPLGLLRGEAGQWRLEEAGQDFRTLLAISGSARNHVVAVGKGRSLLYDGTSWTQIDHPADTLTSVWAGSPAAVYAVDCAWSFYDSGTAGRLMRLDGSAWLPVADIPTGDCAAIWGASPDTVYAATVDGLQRYESGSFTTLNTPRNLLFVDGTGAGEVIAGGYVDVAMPYGGYLPHPLLVRLDGEFAGVDRLSEAGVVEDTWGVPAGDAGSGQVFALVMHNEPKLYEHTDSGWVATPVPARGVALAGRSAEEVYVADDDGGIHRFDGSGFITEREGGSRFISALWGSALDQLWAAGTRDSGALVARYDGSRWHDEFAGPPNIRMSGLWGASSADLWAVGAGFWGVESGLIAHYDGDGWSSQTTDVHLYAIWGAGPDAVFAGGAGGVIFHYDGSTWKRMPEVPTEHDITDLWGWAEDDLYATTANYYSGEGELDGELLHYDGSSWTIVDSFGAAMALHGTARGDLFVAGSNVFRYRDGTRYSYPLPPDPVTTNAWLIRELWATGNDDIYAMGSDGVLRFDGEAWHPVGPLSVLSGSALWGLPGGDVLAASTGGAIFHGIR